MWAKSSQQINFDKICKACFLRKCLIERSQFKVLFTIWELWRHWVSVLWSSLSSDWGWEATRLIPHVYSLVLSGPYPGNLSNFLPLPQTLVPFLKAHFKSSLIILPSIDIILEIVTIFRKIYSTLFVSKEIKQLWVAFYPLILLVRFGKHFSFGYNGESTLLYALSNAINW